MNILEKLDLTRDEKNFSKKFILKKISRGPKKNTQNFPD